MMSTSDFDFDLPPELIAQTPAPERDQSRLLVLHRAREKKFEHRQFRDLNEHLRGGDILVLNNSRVIPARLRGENAHTGGEFEMLLLEELAVNDWWAMLRPGKRARIGTKIVLRDSHGARTSLSATVLETNEEGHRRVRFEGTPNIATALDALGEVPLPPYINRAEQLPGDRERYQTVFAQPPGSVAAPTAGLHFTDSFLKEIQARGVEICFLTLHVGPGTFAPVKTESLSGHRMHAERFHVPDETARRINDAKASNRRVIAVGTTTLRVLESLAANSPSPPLVERARERRQISHPSTIPPFHHSHIPILSGPGKTSIFIHPPYDFKVVDALLTNFHLPRSTLLMLASAFAAPGELRGQELILKAYAEAINLKYRFFSYGDAMLII